jgi:ubiquinone/menaquinone biosynthesis C-methylase UbiE
MEQRDAVDLIADAIPARRPQVWADFGAGDGTFTRALVDLIGPSGRVYAVDRDPSVLSLRGRAESVIPVVADLTEPVELPGLDTPLDGALFANSLHFIREADAVLARLVEQVKIGGRVVIIEYDRRDANRWVPYPVPLSRLAALARAAALTEPIVTATRRSMYGGELYVAAMDRAQRLGSESASSGAQR